MRKHLQGPKLIPLVVSAKQPDEILPPAKDKAGGFMIQDKVIIPLLKSAITAVLVALFATSWFIGSIPWKLFFAVLSGICLASWLALIIPKPMLDRQTLGKVYPMESQDPKPLKVSIDWNDGQAGLFAEMGIERDQFIAWCIGASQGRSLGENHWCGSKGVFSKAEYHAFRDELINRGIIKAKGRHHAQGFQLTGKGRAVCAEVARRFGDLPSPNDHGRLVITSGRPLPRLRESAREEVL